MTGPEPTQGVRRLEAELDDAVPDGLRALPEEQLADLAARLHGAKLSQSQALEVAIEHAVEIVPRLLRGPVRKILFG